jgi:hypothetical protein
MITDIYLKMATFEPQIAQIGKDFRSFWTLLETHHRDTKYTKMNTESLTAEDAEYAEKQGKGVGKGRDGTK